MRALLMGGQACILYGAAEFTRDVDFAVAVSRANLGRLRAALRDLRAQPVYFPPLSSATLRRGHACHFRCRARGVEGLRIDVMARMRGAPTFATLWRRRVVLPLPGVGEAAVVSLPDLVAIKKTQRDKDWPMVRRLIEADYLHSRSPAPAARVRFWLAEARTYAILADVAAAHPRLARIAARIRPAVKAALRQDARAVARLLRAEEDRERESDRRYWEPLRRELERMRLSRPRS